MMQYTISCANRLTQIIQISLSFEVLGEDSLELCLPAWRPGRYEFQHYARNLFAIKGYDGNQKNLDVHKTDRNSWLIPHPTKGIITISYQYSCTQLDAGGSWIDDALIYINPINCLLYLKEREHESCQLTLDFPDTTVQPATHLLFKDRKAQVENYFRLVDSPFFLSQQQEHVRYEIGGTTFHIWTHGDFFFSKEKLIEDFKAFTAVQLAAMEAFPEKEYHFLLLLLPFTHYHGVEHHQSTVITLGPAQELAKPALYEELISISSHELYHAWNICKIRPREMYPYRLHQENYFRTGFVAEGITTYLGEYFLRQSNFFSEERFLLEIEQWFNRHHMHRGVERASLADSSFDLWVDGYVNTSADYKVSIYVAGALSAIALDLQIRLKNPNQSIFNLMQTLYKEKALKLEGYTESYLQKVIQSFIGDEEKNFWNHCITGHSVDVYVSQALEQFGIAVKKISSFYYHERVFGIKLKPSSPKLEIAKIQVDSPAAAFFMTDDVLLAVNNKTMNTLQELQGEIELSQYPAFTILRKGREISFSIPIKNEGDYWATTSVQKNSGASDEQKLRYNDWMKDRS
ncbi:MAG: peptidase [Chitinophagaceae bacterium]|nr:peptidase [Chitinophagaceae bacterium]